MKSPERRRGLAALRTTGALTIVGAAGLAATVSCGSHTTGRATCESQPVASRLIGDSSAQTRNRDTWGGLLVTIGSSPHKDTADGVVGYEFGFTYPKEPGQPLRWSPWSNRESITDLEKPQQHPGPSDRREYREVIFKIGNNATEVRGRVVAASGSVACGELPLLQFDDHGDQGDTGSVTLLSPPASKPLNPQDNPQYDWPTW